MKAMLHTYIHTVHTYHTKAPWALIKSPHFGNLQCCKMLVCKLHKKVELSSTFLNITRQVVVCDMSNMQFAAFCILLQTEIVSIV